MFVNKDFRGPCSITGVAEVAGTAQSKLKLPEAYDEHVSGDGRHFCLGVVKKLICLKNQVPPCAGIVNNACMPSSGDIGFLANTHHL